MLSFENLLSSSFIFIGFEMPLFNFHSKQSDHLIQQILGVLFPSLKKKGYNDSIKFENYDKRKGERFSSF